MEIFTDIKNQLQFTPKQDIIKQLGYNSLSIGMTTLDRFLNTQDLETWLSNGHYDFKYTSLEFFQQLALILKYPKVRVTLALASYRLHQQELDKYKNSYLYIQTDFKKTTQPIHVLAMCESQRRISISSSDFCYKSNDVITSMISNIIKKHYKQSQGSIGIWGTILNYHYNNQAFDINGTPINDEVFESKATLTINGKILMLPMMGNLSIKRVL